MVYSRCRVFRSISDSINWWNIFWNFSLLVAIIFIQFHQISLLSKFWSSKYIFLNISLINSMLLLVASSEFARIQFLLHLFVNKKLIVTKNTYLNLLKMFIEEISLVFHQFYLGMFKNNLCLYFSIEASRDKIILRLLFAPCIYDSFDLHSFAILWISFKSFNITLIIFHFKYYSFYKNNIMICHNNK